MSSVRKDTGVSPKKLPQAGLLLALGVGGLVVLAIGFWLTLWVVGTIKSGLGVASGTPNPPPAPKAPTRPAPARPGPGTPTPTLARAAADEFLANLREGRLRQAHSDTTKEFQDDR